MDGSQSAPLPATDTISQPVDLRRQHFARAALIGLLAGLIAVAFQVAFREAEHLRIVMLERLAPHPYWGWIVLPAIGLLVGSGVGLMVQCLAPEAAGSGIPHIKGVLLGVRSIKVVPLILVKFIGGVLGIGVGLSLGREGPTVQMGAAIGQGVANRLKVRQRTVPQLISCGAGAGLAAAFNAPLAGFVFVIEELHREFSALTFGGALIAAVVATVVTQSIFGQGYSFSVRGFPELPLVALPLVALLGLLGGLLGVAFNAAILRGQRQIQGLTRVPVWLRPGLAAVIVGFIAWFVPQAAGGGHAMAGELLSEHWQPSFFFLLFLLGLKLFTTVISYASGAPGGVFAPILLIGAILGLAFGRVAGGIFQGLADNQTAFAVLGMAALFTASVRAPLTGIVLILELTGNYQQLFAVCVACLMAYLTAETLHSLPLYEALLEDDLRRHGLGKSHSKPIPVVMGVQRDSAVAGKALRDAQFPRDCVVIHVERGGRELIPTADLELSPGDHVTVLAPGDQPALALRIVDLCRSRMS